MLDYRSCPGTVAGIPIRLQLSPSHRGDMRNAAKVRWRVAGVRVVDHALCDQILDLRVQSHPLGLLGRRCRSGDHLLHFTSLVVILLMYLPQGEHVGVAPPHDGVWAIEEVERRQSPAGPLPCGLEVVVARSPSLSSNQ